MGESASSPGESSPNIAEIEDVFERLGISRPEERDEVLLKRLKEPSVPEPEEKPRFSLGLSHVSRPLDPTDTTDS